MLNFSIYLIEQPVWIIKHRFALHQVSLNLQFALRKDLGGKKKGTSSFPVAKTRQLSHNPGCEKSSNCPVPHLAR